MWEVRKPDWDVWCNVPNVTLWEGVALSLDLEPTEVDYDMDSMVSMAERFDIWRKFKKRLLIACRNIGQGGALTPTSISLVDPGECKVSRHEFAGFARSRGWDMPQELEEFADTVPLIPVGRPSSERQGSADLAPKERNYLLRIIRVLADMAELPKMPHKAGQMVENHAQTLGVELGARAVADKLKAASEMDD